jgi:dephospho-CoA kinase
MKPLKIGLTGGIASGKSVISQQFANQHIDIIDADKIAKDLFVKDAPLLKTLKAKFGSKIFTGQDDLDRKALGNIVFNSEEDLAWLNQLTHPLITKEIKSQLSRVRSPYVILDIPLLINQFGEIPSHLKALIDRVLVIEVSLENQIKRLCLRDNISEEAAMTIIRNQSTLTKTRD